MKRHEKLLTSPVPGWVILLLFLGMPVIVLAGQDWNFCANEVERDLVSPDGRHRAVMFTRNCGATTGYGLQLSVVSAKEALPNESGNVFTLSDKNPRLPPTFAGPLATMVWISANMLEIRHDARTELGRAETEHDGVRIRYVVINGQGI